MGLVLIIIAVFVALALGAIYSMIRHAQQMPADYDMSEYEIKLKQKLEK